jgi:hypothetical protein
LSWWRATKGFREERQNLFVYSPLLLPFPYSRVARWINGYFMFRALRRWSDIIGFHRPVVWSFLPTPLALDVINAVDPRLTIYYCIDDLARSSHGARKIVASEEKLFKNADLVFVTSEKLRQRAAGFRPDVHLFRSVSASSGSSACATSPRPRRPTSRRCRGRSSATSAGCISGSISNCGRDGAPHARRLVRAGRAGQSDISLLKTCPNIHLLGQRTHDEVPAYVNAFDVALVRID